MLNRDALLSGKSFLPFEEVSVPELGGTVGVQGMTAGDAMAYYVSLGKRKADERMDVDSLAKLVVRCCVDDQRQRVFEDDEWTEVVKWPNSALQRVALAAMRVNNGTIEGNLGATTADGSASA